MYGMPAGFEDDSDDEFMMGDFNNDTVQHDFERIDMSKSEKSLFLSDTEKKSLEEKMNLKSEDIRIAVIKGDKNYVQKALETGFDIDQELKDGWTALMYACCSGFPEIVKLLLESNASPNFNKDMFTPLMAVCTSAKRNEDDLVNCAELVTKYGAKVNLHDRHLMTSIMYASKLGYAKLVKFLCENDCDLNKQETRGWTAACFAASNGFSHVIRVLIEHKADISITTFDGQRPTDIAFANGFTMLSELLDKYDGRSTEQFENVPNEVSCLAASSSSSSKYVKYGDLELFLFGLELGHLVKLFQEHRLEFKDLLTLTDEEMIEIGITQLGVRKKLVNAIHDVHTNQWKIDIMSPKQISKLSLLDSAAVISNITKHLSCVQSSVKYLNQHITKNSKDLAMGDTTLQKALLEQCIEAIKVAYDLQADLQRLNIESSLIFPNADQKPVNLIQRTKHQLGVSRTRKCVTIAFTATLCCGAVFMGYKVLKSR